MADGRRGLAAGIGACFLWGLMPLYLRLVAEVSVFDVLSHRVVWSFVVLILAALASAGRGRVRAAFRTPRLLLMLAASALLIGVNWLVYTWAVLNGHVLDASLGFFINPLLNVAVGVAFLGDRFSIYRRIAVGLAVTGVAVLTVAHGALPWISVALAVSFGAYGLVRKHTDVDAVTGLLIETLLLLPVALIWLELASTGIWGHGGNLDLLLAASGLVTTLPLALFGYAARRLSFSTLGFLQYLAPSMVFVFAILIFGETPDMWKLVAFLFIWAGLLVYSIGGLRAKAIPARS